MYNVSSRGETSIYEQRFLFVCPENGFVAFIPDVSVPFLRSLKDQDSLVYCLLPFVPPVGFTLVSLAALFFSVSSYFVFLIDEAIAVVVDRSRSGHAVEVQTLFFGSQDNRVSARSFTLLIFVCHSSRSHAP